MFVAAGVIGFAYHVTEFNPKRLFEFELVWACLLRLLAILGGVFVLRGNNWARWLLLVWIAYHVILSAFHSMSELVAHGVLFVVIACDKDDLILVVDAVGAVHDEPPNAVRPHIHLS